MTIARRLLVDREHRGVYHCISRCVRRALLCGGEFEHRKDWVRDRLQLLSEIFAVDVGAYAVLSNHLHLVIRTDPQAARRWPARAVAERWARLYPGDVARWHRRRGEAAGDDPLAALAGDADRLAELRDRLGDLSWFMKCLKETIARRANREDRVTGCFWEGRFRSHALLDDAAVLSCMVYVDLNLVRAALASTPESSSHTSVQDRIHVRQRYEKAVGRRRRAPRRATRLVSEHARGRVPRHAEDGIWLAPIEQRGRSSRDGMLAMTLEQYLRLVDSTGRSMQPGKPGSIPPELAPILERLAIDSDRWGEAMSGARRLFGTAVGSAERLAGEAARRGGRWVVGVLDVYRA